MQRCSTSHLSRRARPDLLARMQLRPTLFNVCPNTKGKEGACTCSQVPDVPTYTFRIANTISASLRHTAPYHRHEQLTVHVQKSSLLTPAIYKPTHTTDSTSRTRFEYYSTHYLLTLTTPSTLIHFARRPKSRIQPSPAQSTAQPAHSQGSLMIRVQHKKSWCNTRRKTQELKDAALSHRWLHTPGPVPTLNLTMHAGMRVCVRMCGTCNHVTFLVVSPSILDIAPHVLRLPFVLAPLPRPTVLRYMVLRYIFVLRLVLFTKGTDQARVIDMLH